MQKVMPSSGFIVNFRVFNNFKMKVSSIVEGKTAYNAFSK